MSYTVRYYILEQEYSVPLTPAVVAKKIKDAFKVHYRKRAIPTYYLYEGALILYLVIGVILIFNMTKFFTFSDIIPFMVPLLVLIPLMLCAIIAYKSRRREMTLYFKGGTVTFQFIKTSSGCRVKVKISVRIIIRTEKAKQKAYEIAAEVLPFVESVLTESSQEASTYQKASMSAQSESQYFRVRGIVMDIHYTGNMILVTLDNNVSVIFPLEEGKKIAPGNPIDIQCEYTNGALLFRKWYSASSTY